MSWPAQTRGVPFWDIGIPDGVARVDRFTGRRGLQALTGAQITSADDPAAFAAELTRLKFGRVLLEEFAATPHRVTRGDEQMRTYPTPLSTIVVVTSGSLHVVEDGFSFVVAPGEGLAIDTRRRIEVHAHATVRMVRSVIDLPLGPDEVAGTWTLPGGAAPGSGLLDGFSRLVQELLQLPPRRPFGPPHAVGPAMRRLHEALLDEAAR